MIFGSIHRQLERIEGKLDRHIEAQNGHKARTLKGIPITWWLIGILLAGVLGADFVIDALSAFSSLGG